MTHYPHQPVVVLPEAKAKQFREALRRHGYEVAMREVIGKASSANAKATHYVLEVPADAGLLAAVKSVSAKLQGVTVTNGKRGAEKAASVLDKAGLKVKPGAKPVERER